MRIYITCYTALIRGLIILGCIYEVIQPGPPFSSL